MIKNNIHIICIILGVALDQIIKKAVVDNIELYESAFEAGFFTLTYIQNRGAAFGIFEGATTLLTVITGIVILAMFLFLCFRGKMFGKLIMWAITLIVTGGIGNLIDRVTLGYVVDYLSFWSFPVFNLADMLVVIGAGLVIIYIFFFDNDGKK